VADTVYVDTVTLITADSMNDFNRVQYTILGDPATAIAALNALTVNGSDIASPGGGTLNLDAATGDCVDVTGTNSITAITLAAGDRRIVRFTGILTLTHGSSLVLPGALNITTAAGDIAIFQGYASSVVRCVSYQKLTGDSVRGGLVFLGSRTASASATLEFASLLSATYDEYIFEMVGLVPATDAQNFLMRLSIDNGSNYKSGASDYQYYNVAKNNAGTDLGIASAGATAFIAASGVSSTAGDGGINGQIHLYNVNSTTQKKQMKYHINTYASATGGQFHVGGGTAVQATITGAAVNAVQFLMGSGNLTSGTIYLYGVKKA
jgi:hypothetical protein